MLLIISFDFSNVNLILRGSVNYINGAIPRHIIKIDAVRYIQ